jgi:hypothetical protein
MNRLMGSLIRRRLKEKVILEVVRRWWKFYYEKGTIRGNPKDAPRSVRNFYSREFTQEMTPDQHRENLNSLKLNMEDLREAITSNILNTNTKPNKTNTSIRSITFVEGMVLFFYYERIFKGIDGPIKATNSQWADIVLSRAGRKLTNAQIERYKEKFVSRPGKPASVLELVEQVDTGHTGKPSTYVLTGIESLFASVSPQDAPGDDLEAPNVESIKAAPTIAQRAAESL